MGKLLTSLARWAKMPELDKIANKNNDNRVTVSKKRKKKKRKSL